MTLTGYENAIRDFTAEHSINIGRSKIQRLAKQLHKQQIQPTGESLAKAISYADPTGEAATRNVMTAAAYAPAIRDHAAAHSLALSPADVTKAALQLKEHRRRPTPANLAHIIGGDAN